MRSIWMAAQCLCLPTVQPQSRLACVALMDSPSHRCSPIHGALLMLMTTPTEKMMPVMDCLLRQTIHAAARLAAPATTSVTAKRSITTLLAVPLARLKAFHLALKESELATCLSCTSTTSWKHRMLTAATCWTRSASTAQAKMATGNCWLLTIAVQVARLGKSKSCSTTLAAGDKLECH